MAGVMPLAEPPTQPLRGHQTICLAWSREPDEQCVEDPQEFRQVLDQQIEAHPERFPPEIPRGARRKDLDTCRKTGGRRRRIALRKDPSDRVRPSFGRPSLTGHTEDVQAPLELRKVAVPAWARTQVFGRNPMDWHRLERARGRFSRGGTTVKDPERLPPHRVADATHTPLAGTKIALAATAGGGCCLGLAWAEKADQDDRTSVSGVFREEARDLDPEDRPPTVHTDGWAATPAAGRTRFKGVTRIRGFRHAFLTLRERAQPLKETFETLRERVWGAYHAADARTFAPRLRRLRQWAAQPLDQPIVRVKVLSLCDQRDAFVTADAPPGCPGTSNPVDR